MGRWPGERMMPRKRGREGWPLQLDSWGKKRKPWDSSGEICIQKDSAEPTLCFSVCQGERGEERLQGSSTWQACLAHVCPVISSSLQPHGL